MRAAPVETSASATASMLELLPPPAITCTFILALRSMPSSSQSRENTRSTLKCREANAPVGITTSISRGDSPASRMAPRAASTAASISLRSGKRPDGTSPMPTTAADAARLNLANCLSLGIVRDISKVAVGCS